MATIGCDLHKREGQLVNSESFRRRRPIAQDRIRDTEPFRGWKSAAEYP
jgi:hypothetical protein